MAWSGTLIGGALGMCLGGPIGLGVGAGLGRIIDNYREQQEQRRAPQRSVGEGGGGGASPSVPSELMFVAVWGSLGKMAKADGVVSRSEVELVQRLMRDQFEFSAEEQRLAQEVFNRSKNDAQFSVSDILREFADVVGDPELREMVFRMLFMVAMADGEMHPAEASILRQAGPALRLPAGLFEECCEGFGVGVEGRKGEASLDGALAVLGLKAGATLEEIKKAYRKKVQEFHPDKLASKGLPEAMMKFAEEEFKRVQAAYERCVEAHR